MLVIMILRANRYLYIYISLLEKKKRIMDAENYENFNEINVFPLNGIRRAANL